MRCWLRSGARTAAAVATLALAGAPPSAAFETSMPLDCLPDALIDWRAALPDPEARFGAANLPGIVLGPPGDSGPTTGSTSVASLGNGGTATFEFLDVIVEDRPGADFIVFENAFFVGAPPSSPSDDYQIFAEPGIVSVSADGVTWLDFPYDAQALTEAIGSNIDRELHGRLVGLAGITPTFGGNWTEPDDPEVWDPTGQGGVSGAGGDAFDLADVGLAEARFVRITDADSRNGPAGSGEGFDVDAIVVLHGRPRATSAPDPDADGLSDGQERELYGSDPDRADSDGDGVDDGREVAGCRDPNTFATDPWWLREPRLWVRNGGCTELNWTFLGTGASHDAIRGNLDELAAGSMEVDLGTADCLSDDTPGVRWSCDADLPAPSAGFYYLVRESTSGHYGRSSGLEPRHTGSGCP